jgi:hypothetical protein
MGTLDLNHAVVLTKKGEKDMRDVVIVSGVRTPVGAFGGSLQSVPVVQLGAIALKEA